VETPTVDGFAALAQEETGFLLGVTLLGGGIELTEGLPSPWRERCGAAMARLAGLAREEKTALLAEMARAIAEPVPAGLEALHPSWMEDALAGEPPDLVLALAGRASEPLRNAARVACARRGIDGETYKPREVAPAVLMELRKLVLGPLARLARAAASQGGNVGPRARALGALPEPELLREITIEGARVLGRSLAGAPPAAAARAMAAVGPPYDDAIATGAASAVGAAEREVARAFVGRVASVPSASAEDRLRQLGLLALGEILRAEGAEGPAFVAAHLPSAWGRQLVGG
jgi:hypothetical protein